MYSPSGNKSEQRDRELGELLGIGLQMFQENIGILLGGTAILGILPLLPFIPAVGIVLFMAGGSMDKNLENIDPAKIVPMVGAVGVASLISLVIYIAAKVGFTAACLKITRGERPSFSEFTTNTGYFLNFFGVSLLLGLAVLVGTIFLIVPGIFLAVKLIFAPFLVIDKNMGPMEALQESWALTGGIFWKIFLAGLAYIIINAVVGAIPIIGIVAGLATYPFFEVLLSSIYRSRTGTLAA